MPVTVRIPSFGGIGAVEHHSESTESYWLHTAGLKVVVPSTPSDAYWLLRQASSRGAVRGEGVQGAIRGAWHIQRIVWERDGLRLGANGSGFLRTVDG